MAGVKELAIGFCPTQHSDSTTLSFAAARLRNLFRSCLRRTKLRTVLTVRQSGPQQLSKRGVPSRRAIGDAEPGRPRSRA